MQNSMVMFTFIYFQLEISFWTTFISKFKIICLSWNLLQRLTLICRIQWWSSLFLFQTSKPILSKFGLKNQFFQFKLKHGPKTNLIYIIWYVIFIFIFSVLDQKYHFWANLYQKIKIISLSWNLVQKAIRIWRIHWRC